MNLEYLHIGVFVLMFITFLVSNYIIALKFIQLRKRPNSTLEEIFNWTRGFRDGLWWLDFSATTSPLVGLLGTTIALIQAFQSLSAKGISGATEITAAIGFALVATALGILLSLWNYLFFKYFQNKLSNYKEYLRHKIMKEALSEE